MRIVMFCHSLISDWNHGNAHFLRGVVVELLARGHDVRVFEPRGSWSMANLLREQGPRAVTAFHSAYPTLSSVRFDEDRFDLDEAIDGADLVLVHEWNSHPLVKRIGRHHARGGAYVLLFHDTHHRSVTDPETIAAYDLNHYDGVLAFGEVIRESYLTLGWAQRAWTWHEAADVTRFRPADGVDAVSNEGDLVWIGNWGDDERSEEIRRYFVDPVRALGLRARVHGVRYPDDAISELRECGISYGGWIPNHTVPSVFAQYTVTVHIPRQAYVRLLPGIPTIRMFEALACGIPLVSCRWDDCERLFSVGQDYLAAGSPSEMIDALRRVLNDADLRGDLVAHAIETIRSRHTCAHRVDELMTIAAAIQPAIRRTVTA